MRSFLAGAALLCVAALTGCQASVATNSNSVRMAPGEKVSLDEIRFEYEQWNRQDSEFLESARAAAENWRSRMRTGFDRANEETGMKARAGATVPVTVRIVDLDPGNSAMRSIFKSDSARAIALAQVTVEGRGEMEVGCSIEEGTHAGMASALESLGEAIARGIASSPLLPLDPLSP